MNTFLKNKRIFFLLAAFISFSVIIFSSIDGRTGRTLKSSTSGCGGCHGSAFTPDVTTTISGADTVIQGQTSQYTLTITRASKTGAGLDVATRLGTLSPVSSNIHLTAGELTHNNNIPMSGGTVTVTFNYTAPASSGVDTLWAIGLATNSDGNTSGDDWNWSPSKRIIVRAPLGINNNEQSPVDYKLEQNYPNPFNPNTVINFSIQNRENVSLVIYDITGSEVYTLINNTFAEGSYSVNWNGINNFGSSVSSGYYFYVLKAGDFTQTKKMTFIK